MYNFCLSQVYLKPNMELSNFDQSDLLWNMLVTPPMGLCLKVTSRPQYHLGGGMILTWVFVSVSSLLLAVMSLVPQVVGVTSPPRTPPPSLSPVFLNLRGSVWSPLLKTAYFVVFLYPCVCDWKVCVFQFMQEHLWSVKSLLKELVHVCVFMFLSHSFSYHAGVFSCSCEAVKKK